MDSQTVSVTTLCQFGGNKAPNGIRREKIINMSRIWLECYESAQQTGHDVSKLMIACMYMIDKCSIQQIITSLHDEYDHRSIYAACNYAREIYNILGEHTIYSEVDLKIDDVVGRCDAIVQTIDGYAIIEFKHTDEDTGYSQLFHYAALASLNRYNLTTLILCNTKLAKIAVYTVTDRFTEKQAYNYLSKFIRTMNSYE